MLFENFDLDKRLLDALASQGFTEATPIQELAIPPALEGKDIVGHSSTGSGKTLAFTLPIIGKVKKGGGIQILVLTPTRELCVQVSEVMNDFGSRLGFRCAAVFGGAGFGPQVNALRGAEIVVATPGRLLDHQGQRTINLNNVRFLVLDEADKMFEMGFIDDVEKIIRSLPKDRQTLLFSATIKSEIDHIIRKHMKDPVRAEGKIFVDHSLLRQVYYDVNRNVKLSLLVHLIKVNPKWFSMVFCGTRREVDVVARNLQKNNIDALALHGGHAQNKRLRALDALKKGHISVLVATDVAARGLDIRNVTFVYNYDAPKTRDEYIHRIGRTARAGDNGTAVTLLCERDYDNFRSVTRDKSLKIEMLPVPAFEKIPFHHSSGDDGDSQGSFRQSARKPFGRKKGFGGGHGGSFGSYGSRGGSSGSHSSGHGGYGGSSSSRGSSSRNSSHGSGKPHSHGAGGRGKTRSQSRPLPWQSNSY